MPPPAIAAAAMAAQRLLVPAVRSSTGLKLMAGLLAIGGAGLALGAGLSFHAAKTTANPRRPENSTALVTTGLFARTRNPMYLGMVAVSTSYAMWRGSLLGLVPSVALACWLDQFQIPAEEDALAQKYGQAYWQYQRAVPRWIPSTERGKTHAR
ncbi:methyltransferase family protein [Glutamicibacter mysorens]|nr:isoprenylcysteine carboxylmethyltransferase family protein [Glutamicibacter mysorens]